MKKIRSPFFYVGDKYKLMPQLIKLFPSSIDRFIEPFVGGGSGFLNVEAATYLVNDSDKNIINLHKYLHYYRNAPAELFSQLFERIKAYGLTCSLVSDIVPDELKQKHIKTYFAVFNKTAYKRLRSDFNSSRKSDMATLYLLLIYGFNHMIRFNKNGEFNLPVGNVDFNSNVFKALANYLDFTANHTINFSNLDFRSFLSSIAFRKDDFVYLDPPYLIGASEYNKLWGENEEKDLYLLLDNLDTMGVKFGLSNLVKHKGLVNNSLQNWMTKYHVTQISSNYISRFDNSIKDSSVEVFVNNYE